MSICQQEIVRKDGCKQEDVTASPPILRTNTVPDINGITHHNPSFCNENKKPQTDADKKKKDKTLDFKNKKIVLSEIHGSGTKDLFRKFAGYFWNTRKVNNGDELYYVWTEGDLNDTDLEDRRNYLIYFNEDELYSKLSPYQTKKAKITILGKSFDNRQSKGYKLNKNNFELFSEFQNKISNIVQTREKYKDIVFSSFVPFSADDLINSELLNQNKYKANWQFNYNYYNSSYEFQTLANDFPLPLLPNFYVWFSEIENSKSERYRRENSIQRFSDLINLGGGITNSFSNKQKELFPSQININPFLGAKQPKLKNNKIFDIRDSYIFDYFTKWSETYRFLKDTLKLSLERNFFNTILLSKDIATFRELSNNQEIFPYSLDLTFPNQNILSFNSNDFLQILQKTNLQESLLLHVFQNYPIDFNIPTETELNNNFNSSILENVEFNKQENDLFVTEKVGILENKKTTKVLSYINDFKEQEILFFDEVDKKKTSTKKRRVWDLSKWIELFNEFEHGSEKLEQQDALDVFNVVEPDNATFLGSYALDIKNLTNTTNKFINTLFFLAFSAKTKEIIKRENRDILDIFAFGNECYDEILFYKIRKIDVDTNQTVQNFWFSNDSRNNIQQWIDTQLIYNKQYKYEVYSYNFVLGNEYYYDNVNFIENKNNFVKDNKFTKEKIEYSVGQPVVEMDVIYYPNLFLVETLYFEFEGKILDNPPIKPEVEFIPYFNVSDKCLINFRSNVGSVFEKPIIFDKKDEEYYSQLPKQFYQNDKVEFKNDDSVNRFVVYKLEKKPKKYSDFVNSIEYKTNNNAPALSICEKLEKNKKYYYTFRSVDVHGHKSNPTPIYEIEIVDDGGFVYLDTNIIDLKTKNNKKLFDFFTEYIKIEPSVEQTEIDLENSFGYYKNNEKAKSAYSVLPKIGTKEESIIDRQYKIRLTSKKTNKKIDINFKVKHVHEDKN